MSLPITKPIVVSITTVSTGSQSFSEVTRLQCVDDPIAKTVAAHYQVGNTNERAVVILWEGAAYDSVGTWTDAQADARLQELLNA